MPRARLGWGVLRTMCRWLDMIANANTRQEQRNAALPRSSRSRSRSTSSRTMGWRPLPRAPALSSKEREPVKHRPFLRGGGSRRFPCEGPLTPALSPREREPSKASAVRTRWRGLSLPRCDRNACRRPRHERRAQDPSPRPSPRREREPVKHRPFVRCGGGRRLPAARRLCIDRRATTPHPSPLPEGEGASNASGVRTRWRGLWPSSLKQKPVCRASAHFARSRPTFHHPTLTPGVLTYGLARLSLVHSVFRCGSIACANTPHPSPLPEGEGASKASGVRTRWRGPGLPR